MNGQGELLSFLDLLDLDEELIDNRLKSIMVRSNYTTEHLTNALQLLRYKHLINIQENSECENGTELNFVAKLIKELTEHTVDIVCKITNIVLKLNLPNMMSYSEHLLLQILSNLDLSNATSKSDTTIEKSNIYLHLKVCDSVLDATMEQKEKVTLIFLETPLEEILGSPDERLKIYFITSTVPKLVEGVNGYDILNRIWTYLENSKGDSVSTALKVLSSLSDYYLPVTMGDKKTQYESTLVKNSRFWNMLLFGLNSSDSSLRKISVYLAKRAIDYVITLKANVNIKFNNNTLFTWDPKKCNLVKNQWDNFFILIDSLEEKQSNIVLPSLQLFDTFTEITCHWLNCAYKLGLKHDNGQVRLKCIEHRIKTDINNEDEALILLEALNDINFYENCNDSKVLKKKLSVMMNRGNNLLHILKTIPQAHLSPVPFYHLSSILADMDTAVKSNENFDACQVVVNILKTLCNIITVREAIHYNIAQFVGKSCKSFHWKEIATIYSQFQFENWMKRKFKNPLVTLIKSWDLPEEDKKEFHNFITESYLNIDLGMLYLESHVEDVNAFREIVADKVESILNVLKRQYSNKMECFNDVLYILNLQNKCNSEIKKLLPKTDKIIVQYQYALLSCDATLTIEETKSAFSNIHLNIEDTKDIVVHLHMTSIKFLLDSQTSLDKLVRSILVLHWIYHNKYFSNNYKHEMLDFKRLMQLEAIVDKKEAGNAQSLGRWRNMFYETHCKIVYSYIIDEQKILQAQINKNDIEPTVLKEIVDYIEKVTECGGYGCLEQILKIMNKILKYLTVDSDKKLLNLPQFIARMWREIEELKSSNQYLPSMIEFVNLLTQQDLVSKPEYNNTVSLYCSKVIDYGLINNSPLYFLVDSKQFTGLIEQNKDINEYGHLVYILSEILLFCPVPRKDQRIADNLTLEILKNLNEECVSTYLHFNFAIQYKAVHTLSKITDSAILLALITFITQKIDNIFKAKLRYHGNSQVHRTLQTALQHLLYILFMKTNDDDAYFVSDWCIELLGRLPHQLSVRICLEWHIVLNFYMKKAIINTELLRVLQTKNVPLHSQFTIIYWLLKRKITSETITDHEFEFVMDTLLSHTMGQTFNVRLLAQYLATKINILHENNPKYHYIIDVINKTLEENSTDKNFVKLKEDYFINEFDVISNLTPLFIYHGLPRLCDVGNNETVDTKFVLANVSAINQSTEQNMNKVFKDDWMKYRKSDEEFFNLELSRHVDKNVEEDVEALGTIQKKYIPWKSMSDINIYNVEKKRDSSSDLIVVASLIDKLPNLGGMARTSEVFGVKTYVIDSLRHLQDRQFQGLSVSAERWIDVEEVRPGQPLKDYLNCMKAEGYSVVAAEQTSTSSKLQTFKFPKKTLLLLGHEKEGIPCDLLPMMDHCVEIPQQGFVRSLNVHVTAAIFVWEYTRQNLLLCK